MSALCAIGEPGVGMSKKKKEENVISSYNVRDYIDSTADGGYWYVVRDNIAYFVDITKKCLALLGYESLEELTSSGLALTDLIKPVEPDAAVEEEYYSFINEEKEAFNMKVIFINKNKSSTYGEIFIAKSLVFENQSEETIYRVMIHTYDVGEAVFRQSQQLIEKMSNGIAIVEPRDGMGKLIYGNEGFCNILGYSKGELLKLYGVNVFDTLYEHDVDVVKALYEEVLATDDVVKEVYRIFDRDNNLVWIKGEHKKTRVGSKNYIYISFSNVTEFVSVQREIEKTNERLTNFINNTPVGLIVLEKKLESKDDYIVSSINVPTIAKINELDLLTEHLGHKAIRADFNNMQMHVFMKCVDELDIPLVEGMVNQAESQGRSECKIKIRTSSKSLEDNIWINVKIIANNTKKDRIRIVACLEDITKQVLNEIELKRNQEKIINMTYRDGLTNVMNRKSYNEFITARKNNIVNNVGVAFIDINGLKLINDMYGHPKGDDMIKLVVSVIEHYFESDEIYRVSGDEFVIIKENVSQDKFYRNMDTIRQNLDNCEAAAAGYNWNKITMDLSHEIDKAETAMRVAKQNYYATHIEDDSRHRPEALNELTEDIKAGRYIMYLQPKAYTDSTKIVAAESLIRRYDREGNIEPPSEFVPRFEKERLIQLLDFYMLEETCKTIERWNAENRPNIKISVNMSRVTLAEPNYLDKILDITDKYNIDHSQIEFEITESTETMDRTKLSQIVNAVSKLGFGVSLDDMGTEYSSIMMLAIEGIDTVKIDRGFVLQMETKRGERLVKNLIRMCHDLGETCIAEGVEDDDTRMKLKNMGCDMYQGYLLAKPVPVDQFEKLIC